MSTADATYDELTTRIADWARPRTDIRGLAIVGSRGAGGQPDRWSDLDLLVVSRRPKVLLSCTWVSDISEPWLIYPIPSPDGEHRATGAVFREGQATIDFAFVGARSLRAASLLLSLFSRYPTASQVLPPHYSSALAYFARMLRQGAEVIIDKDGVLSRLASAQIRWPPRVRPTEDEFLSSVHAFLGASLWTSKKICRGDLWRSAVSADHDLKQLLLQMIEWHSQLGQRDERDTLYLGRDLHRWADPRIVQSLPPLFSHYTASELLDSLVASLELHAWIAREVAGAWGLHYPEAAYSGVRNVLGDSLMSDFG